MATNVASAASEPVEPRPRSITTSRVPRKARSTARCTRTGDRPTRRRIERRRHRRRIRRCHRLRRLKSTPPTLSAPSTQSGGYEATRYQSTCQPPSQRSTYSYQPPTYRPPASTYYTRTHQVPDVRSGDSRCCDVRRRGRQVSPRRAPGAARNAGAVRAAARRFRRPHDDGVHVERRDARHRQNAGHCDDAAGDARQADDVACRRGERDTPALAHAPRVGSLGPRFPAQVSLRRFSFARLHTTTVRTITEL